MDATGVDFDGSACYNPSHALDTADTSYAIPGEIYGVKQYDYNWFK